MVEARVDRRARHDAGVHLAVTGRAADERRQRRGRVARYPVVRLHVKLCEVAERVHPGANWLDFLPLDLAVGLGWEGVRRDGAAKRIHVHLHGERSVKYVTTGNSAILNLVMVFRAPC